MNINEKIFIIYITILVKPIIMLINLFCQALVALLTSKKTRILNKYSDFFDIFSLDFAIKLLEYTGINNHSIDLLNNKKSFYGLIYSLRLMKLEMLKT